MPVAANYCTCYRNSLVDVSVPGFSFVLECLHCAGDIQVNSNMLENPPINVTVPLTPHHVPIKFRCSKNCHTEGTITQIWEHVIYAHPHAALILDHTLSKVEIKYLVLDFQQQDYILSFLMLSPFGYFLVNVRCMKNPDQLYVGIESVESNWTDWEIKLCSKYNDIQIRKKVVTVPLNTRSILFPFELNKHNCSTFLTNEFLVFNKMPKLFLKAKMN